jgi:hypothetical protein
MVCNRSPASPRCCAPIDLTADVPAGQRPVRDCQLPGRAFVCWWGALTPPSLDLVLSEQMRTSKHIFNTEPHNKDRP